MSETGLQPHDAGCGRRGRGGDAGRPPSHSPPSGATRGRGHQETGPAFTPRGSVWFGVRPVLFPVEEIQDPLGCVKIT